MVVFVSLRYCTQLEYDKNVDGRWNMQVKWKMGLVVTTGP